MSGTALGSAGSYSPGVVSVLCLSPGLPTGSVGGHFFSDRPGGLALTAVASLSPSYWWFIVIFACGRPLLSAADAVAEVSAAGHTGADNRAKAVALVAAGYGVGAGLTAILHGLFLGVLGFGACSPWRLFHWSSCLRCAGPSRNPTVLESRPPRPIIHSPYWGQSNRVSTPPGDRGGDHVLC